MNCGEPLYLDGETYSSRDCQSELGHPGAHDYLGKKFPRPAVTDGLDPEISDLIDQATRDHGAYGLDERQWPVVVEVTNTYVVWVDAETEDEALAWWADDQCDLDLSNQPPIDGSMEIQRADRWQREAAFQDGGHVGPKVACPGCGKLAMSRKWFHNPFRKCHGQIEWRENASARAPQYRYRREFKATPAFDDTRQRVTA